MRTAIKVAVVCCLSCAGLFAGPILTFTHDAGGYVGSAYAQSVGWGFNVVSPISVRQLMWYDPTGTHSEGHGVGIFAGASASPIVQACVGAGCDNGSYWDPVTHHWTLGITATPLAAGSYNIGGFVTAGQNFVWEATSVTVMDASITYGGNRYIHGASLANPTIQHINQLGFFGPNLGLDIPEPATMVLIGAGLIFVGFIRKRLPSAS